jgi:hypothetical protein
MLEDVSPKYGGRNLRPAHGVVNGEFRPQITTGANGCVITTLAFDGGSNLTAPQLAELGLDEPIAPGTTAYLGNEDQYISTIAIAVNPDTTAGDAWLFNNGKITL